MQGLILSRALVLEATTSVLLDYSARRVYDRSSQIEVAYNDMPGVLSMTHFAASASLLATGPAVPVCTSMPENAAARPETILSHRPVPAQGRLPSCRRLGMCSLSSSGAAHGWRTTALTGAPGMLRSQLRLLTATWQVCHC